MILQIYKDNLTVNVFSTLQNDWSSIDTIESWDLYSEFLLENEIVNDYKVLRTKIKDLVTAITGNDYSNFSSLNDNEKMLAVKYLINKLPNSILLTIPNITNEILIEFSNNFNQNSIKARKKRLQKAEELVFTLFTQNSILLLLNDITGGYGNIDLSSRYIKGIEKLNEDGFFGLIDFINTLDIPNSPYITIEGITLSEAKEALLSVIEYGIYR